MLRKSFRAVSLPLGVLLIAAAIFLPYLQFLDLEAKPGGNGYNLIRFHIFLTGLFALLTHQVRTWAIAPNIFFLFINLFLSIAVITENHASFYWLHVLTACSLFSTFGATKGVSKEEDNDGDETLGDQSDDSLDWVDPEFGKIPEGGYFIAETKEFWKILVFTSIGLVFAVPFLVYGQFLSEAIFEGLDFRLDETVDAVKTELFNGIGFQITIFGLVTAFLAVSAFLWARLRVHGDLQNLDYTNRQLNLEERRYLAASIDELFKYVDQIPNRALWRVMYYFQFFIFAAVTLTSPFAIFPIEDHLTSLLIDSSAKGETFVAATLPNYFLGALPTYLFGFSIIWSLVYISGIRFPTYAEYLYAYTGWDNVTDPESKIHPLALSFARYLRLGKISVDKDFSPQQFLRRAFLENQNRTYLIAAFALCAVIAGIFLDISRYSIVSETGIRYSRLQELRVRDASFEDVERVELRCFFYGTDNPPNGKLGLGYRLVQFGEFSIDLLDDRDLTEEYLKRVEQIDSRLVASGIDIVEADSVGFLLRDRAVIADGCSARIQEEFSSEIARKILVLLRLEE